jgi:hypothetical protein
MKYRRTTSTDAILAVDFSLVARRRFRCARFVVVTAGCAGQAQRADSINQKFWSIDKN